MNKDCRQCGGQFEIRPEDEKFYERIKMPLPEECFACRHKHRLSFRNEMSLYHRKCDETGKQMISMYSPDKPYKIYSSEAWWGDDWDPFDYGKEFDFDRPFFEQFKELQMEVPRMGLNNLDAENSDYCNLSLRNKNCYLLYTADYNEDSAYLRIAIKNHKCFDGDYINGSTECYECLEVDDCNRCFYAYKAKNCSELYFAYNMMSCHDCIGCANLVNKRNCVFNEQLSKEDYEKRKAELGLSIYSGLQKFRAEYEKFLITQPRKYIDSLNCENCYGDHLNDSKNSYQCYDSNNLEDCAYIVNSWDLKDCQEWDLVGCKGSELCHNMESCAYGLVDCHFCSACWENCVELLYCQLCLHSQNLFGCVGLRHKKYCILNKQYTKEGYEELVPKIIEHMKKNGEWGEFFPKDLSTYAYNETIANLYFPLTKGQAEKEGYRWYEDEGEKMYKGPKVEIPDDVVNVDEGICKQILVCEETGKPYKIIPQELAFLKRVGLPLPRKSPAQRQKDRMAMRNPFALYERKCSKCSKDIMSSYAADRLELVYCEECYLAEVF